MVTKAKRAVAPVREHRAAAYALVLKEHASDWTREHVRSTIAELKVSLPSERGQFRMVLEARRLATFLVADWALRLATGDTAAAAETGRVARASFLAAQLFLHDLEGDPERYGLASVLQARLIEAYLLLLSQGRGAEAACVRRQLMRLFERGAFVDERNDEPDFFALVDYLMRVDEEGAVCVPHEAEGAALGDFMQLLNMDGPTEAALTEYCDFRVARALGYASHRDTRRTQTFTMMAAVTPLLPLEVFAVRGLVERLTGRDIGLKTAHPMLAALADAFPTRAALDDDAVSEQFEALGARFFGSAWNPMRLISA